MIRSVAHAWGIQERRVAQGKRGIAKAVRKYLHKVGWSDDVVTLREQANWDKPEPPKLTRKQKKEAAEAHRKEQERIAAWKKAHPPATQREREDIEKRLQAMGFPPVHTQPAR